ncbi:hypothetical protein BDV93DRAFT_555809 [Ceratobasidium sp. AG-I]|nr:hypothetical protein BDV93DRAFT_555809 [Ceratobasidium sp. AG-I]
MTTSTIACTYLEDAPVVILTSTAHTLAYIPLIAVLDRVPGSEEDDAVMVDITGTPNRSTVKRAGPSKKSMGKQSTEELLATLIGSLRAVSTNTLKDEVKARNHEIAHQLVLKDAEEAKQRTIQMTTDVLTRVENLISNQMRVTVLEREIEQLKPTTIVQDKEAHLQSLNLMGE